MVILLLVVPVACTSTPQATTRNAYNTSARTPASRTPVDALPDSDADTYALPKPAATVPHVTANGRLSFVQDVKLTFGTSGQVAQVNVK